MTRYKNVNGERVPFTAEEEAARDAEEVEVLAEKERKEAAKKEVLTPSQFTWMLAFTGLDDVWVALEVYLKANDKAAYADLRAQTAKQSFRLPVTLAMVEQFKPIVSMVAPDTDLSEEAIRVAWLMATEK